jgi:hypothetical protein
MTRQQVLIANSHRLDLAALEGGVDLVLLVAFDDLDVEAEGILENFDRRRAGIADNDRLLGATQASAVL